jgi:hypothetical protein
MDNLKYCKICNLNLSKDKFYVGKGPCKTCYLKNRYCIHDKQKYHCKICNPNAYCIHKV